MLIATQINNITIVYHVHSLTISLTLIDSYKIAHARSACLCLIKAEILNTAVLDNKLLNV